MVSNVNSFLTSGLQAGMATVNTQSPVQIDTLIARCFSGVFVYTVCSSSVTIRNLPVPMSRRLAEKSRNNATTDSH